MTRRTTYLAWVATRLVLFVLLVTPRVGGHILFGDAAHYEVWARGILHGHPLPYRDFGWEYPPLAALVIVPPGLVPHGYSIAFVALMVGVDLAMTTALLRLARRLGSDRGLVLWLAGVLLLGPLAYTRYDSFSSLLAVLAALALAAGTPLLAGVAIGGGIAAKLWPAVLLLSLPLVREWRRVLLGCGAVLAAMLLLVLSIGGARHGAETLTKHTTRGLQVESVAATPVVVAQRAGADVHIAFYKSSGSWDLTGTGVAAALDATKVLNAAALVVIALLLWRVRRRPELWLDLPATALLLLAVTDKVLSPQYELWLLGLLAAALCRRDSPLVPAAFVVAVTAPLTQLIYPVGYHDLVHGRGVVVVVVLAIRNAFLVVATALAVVRLWQAGRTAIS